MAVVRCSPYDDVKEDKYVPRDGFTSLIKCLEGDSRLNLVHNVTKIKSIAL